MRAAANKQTANERSELSGSLRFFTRRTKGYVKQGEQKQRSIRVISKWIHSTQLFIYSTCSSVIVSILMPRAASFDSMTALSVSSGTAYRPGAILWV